MTEFYTITRLGHQGDGIADGPVYVPRTLPGEVVSGVREGQTLTGTRIETPSEFRVSPPCRHSRSCGGCQLQHASDDFVADWKQDVVRIALGAQGIETDMRPVHTSPAASRRRATIAVRRTKKGFLAGFHGRASDVITEIPDCKLLDPGLLSGIPVAGALALIGGSRKGVLSVILTLSDAGLDVAVKGGKPLDGPLESALAQATEQHGLARLAWDGEVIAMRAPPYQHFGAARVVPPPGAFLQATHDGELALLASVQEAVAGARRLVDLFAGSGTFSLPLAKEAEIHAVEGDREMVRALDGAWRTAQGLKRVTTDARDLFRRPLMPDELARYDGCVIDPPRAGAEAQIAQLAQARIPAVAYVSCNPVTFARDARVLVGAGYTLNWVQVVDQFRWSSHVELAGSFTMDHITSK
ncbi:MAG: class I SAM-dependent RNA methyltransferase [Mangrovicoccus sp.]|nr:class I SAM-dependent RNA methyltransferase [Mangrovicoccus sp.]